MGISNWVGKFSVVFGREVFFKFELNCCILNFNMILDFSVFFGIFCNFRDVVIVWCDYKFFFEFKKKYNLRKN